MITFSDLSTGTNGELLEDNLSEKGFFEKMDLAQGGRLSKASLAFLGNGRPASMQVVPSSAVCGKVSKRIRGVAMVRLSSRSFEQGCQETLFFSADENGDLGLGVYEKREGAESRFVDLASHRNSVSRRKQDTCKSKIQSENEARAEPRISKQAQDELSQFLETEHSREKDEKFVKNHSFHNFRQFMNFLCTKPKVFEKYKHRFLAQQNNQKLKNSDRGAKMDIETELGPGEEGSQNKNPMSFGVFSRNSPKGAKTHENDVLSSAYKPARPSLRIDPEATGAPEKQQPFFMNSERIKYLEHCWDCMD